MSGKKTPGKAVSNHHSIPEVDRLEKKRPFFTAANELFERFGFKKTTVEEICRTVGASKRTFYQLFDDKLDLLVQLTTHYGSGMIREWARTANTEPRATKRLISFLEMYRVMVHEHQVFKVLFSEVDMADIIGDMAHQAQFPPMIEAMSTVFKYGIETGEFRRMNAEYVTWIVFSMLDTVYFIVPEMPGGPVATDDDSMEREVWDFILNAVVAR